MAFWPNHSKFANFLTFIFLSKICFVYHHLWSQSSFSLFLRLCRRKRLRRAMATTLKTRASAQYWVQYFARLSNFCCELIYISFQLFFFMKVISKWTLQRFHFSFARHHRLTYYSCYSCYSITFCSYRNKRSRYNQKVLTIIEKKENN